MGVGGTTTQWSQVLAARDGTDSEARAALESLCKTYWQPLYAFVRAQGNTPDDAADLTQAYFAELLDKDVLSDVDPQKGRFRAFLLASMRHFLSHQRDRARAKKRGGGAILLSLDVSVGECGYTREPSDELTPEAVFDRRWAMVVIDRALDRLARQSDARKFAALRRYLTGVDGGEPYSQVGEQLGMSEGAVKIAVHRLRQRFGACLRAEIADTVADAEDVNEEVRYLLSIVRIS